MQTNIGRRAQEGEEDNIDISFSLHCSLRRHVGRGRPPEVGAVHQHVVVAGGWTAARGLHGASRIAGKRVPDGRRVAQIVTRRARVRPQQVARDKVCSQVITL